MSEQENLHIKIGLSGTYWDKRPKYRILFNNTTLLNGEIFKPSDEVEYLEFDVEYSTEVAGLQIQLLNKTDSDTVQNADKTSILNDMLLNIVSLEIDDIDLTQVSRDLSEYRPNSPVVWNNETTEVLHNCVNLGWNGTWSLTWTNPFYIWLLENM